MTECLTELVVICVLSVSGQRRSVSGQVGPDREGWCLSRI